MSKMENGGTPTLVELDPTDEEGENAKEEAEERDGPASSGWKAEVVARRLTRRMTISDDEGEENSGVISPGPCS